MKYFSLDNNLKQVKSFIPNSIQKTSAPGTHKKGRSTCESTEILSQFLDKSLDKSPRKDNIRCTLIRRIIKLIRSVNKCKIKISLNPKSLKLLKIISANIDELSKLVNKKNLPYIENKTNKKYKSYNDSYCRIFFSNNVIRELYFVYIDYIFTSRTFEERCKDLNIYCCKDKRIRSSRCTKKWEKLKNILLKEPMEHFGV
ncbi:hypothetical protein SteCoe_25958 [Stentor coeruleus]|uniref:Uncharacterized protein n=1 Tax=Stentor coeruleus TaxID=5963 RepID=A0A1R2BE09_9CILI|nr:hypothetical protein SteCoe_25958 [Stentor coeruleus]